MCPSLAALGRLAEALRVPPSAIAAALDEASKGDPLIADVADPLRDGKLLAQEYRWRLDRMKGPAPFR